MGSNCIQFFGFINQHDGDIVADGIEETAGGTGEPLAICVEGDRPFALWAGQDVEKFLLNHGNLRSAQDKARCAVLLIETAVSSGMARQKGQKLFGGLKRYRYFHRVAAAQQAEADGLAHLITLQLVAQLFVAFHLAAVDPNNDIAKD